ncbi:MAG: hypothetical protein ACLUH5_00255 [Eubacterium sp.]
MNKVFLAALFALFGRVKEKAGKDPKAENEPKFRAEKGCKSR